MAHDPSIRLIDESNPHYAFYPYRFRFEGGISQYFVETVRLWCQDQFGENQRDYFYRDASNMFWFTDQTVATAFKLRWSGETGPVA